MLFGLLAASAFGVGDFLSGMLSRRLSAAAVIGISQAMAVIAIVPVAILATPTVLAVGWGVPAGCASVAASYLLLRGYRSGRLAVVSPCASVSAAGIPVVFEASTGVAFPVLTWTGIAIALVAVVLVSIEPRTADDLDRPRSSGAWWGLGAGAAHAGMYVTLDHAPRGQSWSLVVVFAVGAAAGFGAVGFSRAGRPWFEPKRSWAFLLLIVTGITSAVGWLGFREASASDGVGLAAVLAELSPALTAVLGWIFLRERLNPTRQAGLLLAIAACACLTLTA